MRVPFPFTVRKRVLPMVLLSPPVAYFVDEGVERLLNKTSFSELRRKEVINVCDGARLGHICDLELDICSGLILTILVPGPSRLFGLLHSDEMLAIPFGNVKKFGEDVILVEIDPKI